MNSLQYIAVTGQNTPAMAYNARIHMESIAEVLKRAQKGDQEAFAEIVAHHLPAFFSFAARYVSTEEAEDILQDSWLKIWRNLHRFDTARPFKTWALTIVHRTALDHLKKKKRSVPLSKYDQESGTNAVTDSLQDEEPLPPEVFERKELASQLDEILHSLSDDQRAVVLLYYREHLSMEEISQVMERPVNTVKSWHLRALRTLKRLLTK